MCYLSDCFLNDGFNWVLQVNSFQNRKELNNTIREVVGLAISSLFVLCKYVEEFNRIKKMILCVIPLIFYVYYGSRSFAR